MRPPNYAKPAAASDPTDPTDPTDRSDRTTRRPPWPDELEWSSKLATSSSSIHLKSIPQAVLTNSGTMPRVALSSAHSIVSLRRIRAESAWVRGDADPTEVEPVGIPAGLDRDVGMSPLVSVPGTGTVQEPELVIRRSNRSPRRFQGESGGTGTVFGVSTFVDPPGVVEDGEKLHDLEVGTGLLG